LIGYRSRNGHVSSHPPDEFPSSFCQQPGSPGWPQQSFRFFSLVALFLRRSLIFSESGRGAERFVKKSLMFGLFCLCVCIPLDYDAFLNFRMFAIYLVDKLYNAQVVIARQKRESVANKELTSKFVFDKKNYKVYFEWRHAYDYQEGFKKE
jgi:hypothetical protein